jgi:hypothetical protein
VKVLNILRRIFLFHFLLEKGIIKIGAYISKTGIFKTLLFEVCCSWFVCLCLCTEKKTTIQAPSVAHSCVEILGYSYLQCEVDD